MPPPVQLVLLAFAGVVAGFVNTLAGGGSLITVPALMLVGLPPDIANGTSRVAILVQSLTSGFGFGSEGRLGKRDLLQVLPATLAGALVGAWLATIVPNRFLKPLLVGTMLLVAGVLLLRPSLLAPRAKPATPASTPASTPPSTPASTPARTPPATAAAADPTSPRPRGPLAYLALFCAGAYGGFLQAGVGFVLLSILASVYGYDLVRANALKVSIVGALTAIAFPIFVRAGLVSWTPGLALAAGALVGARLAVRFAIKKGDDAIRRVLLVAAVVTCAAALVK